MRNLSRKKLFLCVLVGFLFVTWISAVNAETRIMPLGDSITSGMGPKNSSGDHINNGYRRELYFLLKHAYFNIDFVGSKNGGDISNGFDPDHEGYPGWTAKPRTNNNHRSIKELLSDSNKNILGNAKPDIVLLHIGTNDFNTNPPPTPVSVVDAVEDIVNLIQGYNNNITVFLARIINTKANDTNISDYNNELSTRFQNRNNIILVDMEKDANGANLLSSNDYSDGTHPNVTGYAKMAEKWFNALVSSGLIPQEPVSIQSSWSYTMLADLMVGLENVSEKQSFSLTQEKYFNYVCNECHINIKPEASIASLWSVNSAQIGQSSTLWAKVENTGYPVLPSGARVWFYVSGPGYSGWVGSASVANLTAGRNQWYYFNWSIPGDKQAGTYTYWAQVWTSSGSISPWSSPQTFTVTNNSSAQVNSLWSVYGAQCGQSSRLWANVKNTGYSVLPSDARVWFYVSGPGYSGWVGSASTSNLAVGGSLWYYFNWSIPGGIQGGTYNYWAIVWTSYGSISSWSSPQSFTLNCQ